MFGFSRKDGPLCVPEPGMKRPEATSDVELLNPPQGKETSEVAVRQAGRYPIRFRRSSLFPQIRHERGILGELLASPDQ
jgi:hypothetical protein